MRKGRVSVAGASYFITINAHERKPIFVHKTAATLISNSLFLLENEGIISIHAYVVMPEHLHVIFKITERIELGKILRMFKSFTGKELSKIIGGVPVWQDGFYDHCIKDEEDFRNCLDYVINNPVKRNLVKYAQDYEFLFVKNQNA